MPGGRKWTGIGLLIGSGMPVYIATFADCIPDEFGCRDQGHAAYAVAGIMAGTGAGLVTIAHARRSVALPADRDQRRPRHRATANLLLTGRA